MTDETILTNAILVLPDATLHGTLVMRGGDILDVQPTRSSTLAARDLGWPVKSLDAARATLAKYGFTFPEKKGLPLDL